MQLWLGEGGAWGTGTHGELWAEEVPCEAGRAPLRASAEGGAVSGIESSLAGDEEATLDAGRGVVGRGGGGEVKETGKGEAGEDGETLRGLGMGLLGTGGGRGGGEGADRLTFR